MATLKSFNTRPTVLSFERKLDPSDALFSAGNWNDRKNGDLWSAVAVVEKSLRGTISNDLKPSDQDSAKLNAAIENPNLQTVDVAMLPADADTLKVNFTLRVLGGAGTPSTCNNADYRGKLLDTVKDYVAANGFGELARRYAHNLANGRFLWRNRLGAEQVEVQVAQFSNGAAVQSWTFDALSLSLRNFDSTHATADKLAQLSALLAQGLSGTSHVLLRVTAFVRCGAGQEVFPSQELILEGQDRVLSNGKKVKKSKTLYKVNSIAGMHSQKLGNALRTVDTWYSGADVNGPIAMEPYGSVTTQGYAYRRPKQGDFYTLLDNWLIKEMPLTLEEQHFVIAILIRGGVFSPPSGK